MAAKEPWKRPKPKSKNGASHHLTQSQKAAARKRAKKAGRRYPNLVDNMWASEKGKGDAKGKSD